MEKKKREYQSFSATVGARSFPQAADVKIKDIIGTPIIVKDAVFKEMQFGEVVILLFEYPEMEGAEFSVLVGGEVVRHKVKEAKTQGLLPLVGTIIHNEVYYDIA